MLKFPKSLHLIQDFIKSDDYILIKDIESLGNSYRIFFGNYTDFKAALEEHKEKSEDGSIWYDKQIRREILDKLVRLMYNFFSSASTLVNHTLIHKRKLHKSDSVIAVEYQEYINADFAKDPLHCFVKDFRNFLCHSSLPYLISVKKFGHGGGATTFEVKKTSLDKFKWEPIAKAYISSLPDTFDIEAIVDLYFSKVESLHEWYKFRQLQLYKEVYTKVLIEKRLLLKLATEDGIASALPYNQTDIDNDEQILKTL